MKKRVRYTELIVIIVLAAVMIFAGCTDKKNVSGNPLEMPTAKLVEYTEYTGVNGKTITAAAQSANTVNGYYYDIFQTKYVVENMNSVLVYNLAGHDGHNMVESLSNKNGGVYIENTMETYAVSSDGTVYYSGKTDGRANLYDQGYYYYNLHVLDQSFIPDNPSYDNEFKVDIGKPSATVMTTEPKLQSDGSYMYSVTDPTDPYLCYRFTNPIKTKDYDNVILTIKSNSTTRANIYYIAGSQEDYNAAQNVGFSIVNDGEFHTYTVNLSAGADYTGTLKGIRIDAGDSTNEKIYIKDFSVVRLSGSYPQVKIDRCYNVYPDKINEYVRLVATEKTNSVSEFGTITKIDASTVAAVIVKDAAGTHDSIDGIDWNSAEYAGFDIKDAGIFGYILANDETSGTMTITLEDGKYVITQRRTVGVKELSKSGESFMPRRIYTDENHNFDDFLFEAECERHPLTDIRVDTEKPKAYRFAGYDVLTGAYTFNIKGLSGGFDEGYLKPYDEHSITFTVKGDNADRKIYVRGDVSPDGCLECAVVLDESKMLLPIKVECCKNFARDGEELFYTYNDGLSYGLSIFPLVCEAGKDTTVTLADLYECWGNYRLKQISSIRFHTAYYHLSLGVTETNCINFYHVSRLPDHRGLSAKYWKDEMIDLTDASGVKTGKTASYDSQPQHMNVGDHRFLSYIPSGEDSGMLSRNVGNTNVSDSGPTLADITLNYLSYDGLVYQTYRHVEMPQTDENRAYYEIDYEVLGDFTVDNFRDDVTLYSVGVDRLKFGYLDENNQPQITDASKDGKVSYYRLGSDSPYFDYFVKPDSNPDLYDDSDVYSNTSVIILSGDIVIGGKKWNGNFMAVEGNNKTRLTLDISGKVTFKKGDHIKLLVIFMPWGSYESENDNNVRNVRINTALHPMTITVSNGTKGDDAIVPTAISANKTDCEFTLSGGYDNTKEDKSYAIKGETMYKTYYTREYNITVKVQGFEKLGVPVIYENVGGSWERYNIASELGYDGYNAEYEPDGTFTYSFVVTMSEAKDRTFRVEVK